MTRLIVFIGLSALNCLCYSQHDGQIIEKKRIKTLSALIEYVKETEKTDSVYFDESRFEYFNKAQVFGITYLSDGLKVKGFLLQPKKKGIYPGIIYNRGGSLDFGSLTHPISSIGLGELARLASEGFVIAASQYRGNGGGEGLEEYGGSDINDVLNLIPLLGTETKADTSRLGLFGWSRGGMTSLLTLKRTNRVKVVALGGPSTNLVKGIADRPELDEWWGDFIPNYHNDKENILKKRSAIYWVDELPNNIPILILQGANDKALAPDETISFIEEMHKHEIPFRFIMYEGGNHSLSTHREEAYHQIVRWFNKYLKN